MRDPEVRPTWGSAPNPALAVVALFALCEKDVEFHGELLGGAVLIEGSACTLNEGSSQKTENKAR